ncbi:MAG: di-trans,poly-cis-decaprenylcistransferase [Spirochaetales bacterium]|nr:di-trans,poly-cis-decaprenylcistransferase [Spirochaetales bacterium]
MTRALLSPEILGAKDIPRHVGIIMDGNGRWAQARGLSRTAGHKEGLFAAKRVVKAARELSIPYLSLYTFSTENWNRTQEEVSFLMNLLGTHLRKEFDFYRENQIRVVHSGNPQGLPQLVLQEIADVVEDTQSHLGLTVNLAINYGGRDEISRAASRAIEELKSQVLVGCTDSPESWNNRIADLFATFSKNIASGTLDTYLDHPELPDLDLIVRSGGEQRLSNFLLWQSSYAEFVFDDKLWPDWDEQEFFSAIRTYQNRKRRFGGN